MHKAILKTPDGPLTVPELKTDIDNVWFSLVIPTYNEQKNLSLLLTEITARLDVQYSSKYEVIIVDDDSEDGTFEIAMTLADRYEQLRLISRKNKRGLATAVVRGWQQARGTVLGVMDGDLQHPSSVLLELLQAIENDADLAVASRYVEGGSVGRWLFMRHVLSKGAQWLGTIILPDSISLVNDPMSGYFVLKRDVIAGKQLNPQGYKILLEVLVRGKAKRIVEIPFQFGLRQHGQTKVTWRQYCQYVFHLLMLRCYLWQRLFKGRK